MAQTQSSTLEQIHALLASKRYSVTEAGNGILRIQEMESGITLQAVLESDILFLSLVCITLPAAKVTPAIMRKMLSVDSGISTSHFQLVDTGDGNVTVTLNNFCKLQDMGPEDEDDILSCVHFLLVDVMSARRLLGSLAQ